eukprot:TRINITY_DN6051_c0_g1_i5.p1 TRINITY_DN6051_c0_g1~~TRINITY_DN6051_c0_g1_i5.p1  ORF type:complete len:258 (-),score=-35.98 TRINITY_DN6051_c0_g1_i5:27-800(-)
MQLIIIYKILSYYINCFDNNNIILYVNKQIIILAVLISAFIFPFIFFAKYDHGKIKIQRVGYFFKRVVGFFRWYFTFQVASFYFQIWVIKCFIELINQSIKRKEFTLVYFYVYILTFYIQVNNLRLLKNIKIKWIQSHKNVMILFRFTQFYKNFTGELTFVDDMQIVVCVDQFILVLTQFCILLLSIKQCRLIQYAQLHAQHVQYCMQIYAICIMTSDQQKYIYTEKYIFRSIYIYVCILYITRSSDIFLRFLYSSY